MISCSCIKKAGAENLKLIMKHPFLWIFAFSVILFGRIRASEIKNGLVQSVELWIEYFNDALLHFASPCDAVIDEFLRDEARFKAFYKLDQVIESNSRPRLPQTIELNLINEFRPYFDYHRTIFYYDFINCINIKSEGFSVGAEDKVVLNFKVSAEDSPIHTVELNLVKALFDSAVCAKDLRRLGRLIQLDAHLFLSDTLKSEILIGAIYSCVSSTWNSQEIIKMLLENDFFKSESEIYAKECPFYNVLMNPEIIQVFLDYDADFFKKEFRYNYVKLFIKNQQLEFAEGALKAGCDGSIEIDGSNALDEALNAVIIEPSEKLSNLIRKMKKKYGIKIAFTFRNFINCCKKKRFDNALAILKYGNISVFDETWKFNSPLSVSIESGSPDLIDYALEHFCVGLDIAKLSWALGLARISTSQDQFAETTLLKAQEKIIFQIQALSIGADSKAVK